MSALSFTRCREYKLEWDVWEGHAWSGFMRYDHALHQWIYRSSDDSLMIKLGRTARDAKRRLRARYLRATR